MSLQDFDVSTPVRRHYQDVFDYCGAACAQMAIAAHQSQIVDQDVLYNAVASPPPWLTSPDDLAATLSQYFRPPYEVVSHARSRVWVMRRIAWSMCRHGHAAMALVLDGGHWVVIEGLLGTVDDEAGPEYQPVITDIIVSDPAPDLVNQREALYVVAPTPPPHDAADLCGSATFEEESYSAAGWAQTFTRCDVAGQWHTHWVAVCVPQEKPVLAPSSAASAGGAGGVPPGAFEMRRPAAGPWNADRLMDVAKLGLRASGLRLRPAWMEAVAAVTRCSVRLVRHLDRGDAYYLLVLADDDGRGRLIVRLDAGTMQVLHAVRGPSPTYVNQLVKLPDTDRLVWKACAETRSPLFPLVEVDGGAPSGYRLLSGRIVPRLTPLRRVTPQ